MAGELNQQRGDEAYRRFYERGGWKYSFWKEYWWHRRQVVKRFGLRRGMSLLEVACGNGFHTNLFRRMGFDCVGIDRSEAGIAWARKRYPRCRFESCDLRSMPFEPGTFDVVLARGLSHYHYDLTSDVALTTTETLLRCLAPGGVFVMAIATDLSGRRESDKIWQNTLEDYRRHFSAHGGRWSVDWADGMVVCGLHHQAEEETLAAAQATPVALATA